MAYIGRLSVAYTGRLCLAYSKAVNDTALYSEALSLPDPSRFDELADQKEALPTAKSVEMANEINARLTCYLPYWEVFDPLVNEVPVEGSLGDDLAHIYNDLSNTLAPFDQESIESVSACVWVWKEGLALHWGRHLVTALSVIHRLLFYEINYE